uniref:NB-ARC domain-containing protein n=1 Tax=Salix viminalis TaxID=40686 RepID=A0A6N2MFM0_SALVM
MHDLIRDMALQIMSQEPWLKLKYKLELITDSFLKQLCELKVLDLSFTAIQELPGSISGLVCLAALLLRGCYKMRHVPSSAKLKTLEMLDFCYATLEEVPHGLELQCNLSLQQSLEERQLLGTFILGQLGGHIMTYFILSTISKKIYKEVQLTKLVVAKCHDARNLCNVQATGLKSLILCECDGIDCLISLSRFSTHILKRLETFHVYRMKNLPVLFGRGATLQPLPSNGTFSCLQQWR